MRHVFKRELQSYFKTPHAYTFIAAFLLAASVLFMQYNISDGRSSMGSVMGRMSIVVIFIIPFLTLGMFTQDRKLGTDKLYSALPLDTKQIVFGKFFAALCVLLATMVICLIYPLIISLLGSVAMSEVLTLYLGFTLLCTCMIAVCMFTASITESRMTAVIVGMGGIFMLLLADRAAESVSDTNLREIVSFLSIFTKFEDFERGILSLSSVIYMCSFSFVLLVFTSMVETFKRTRRKNS